MRPRHFGFAFLALVLATPTTAQNGLGVGGFGSFGNGGSAAFGVEVHYAISGVATLRVVGDYWDGPSCEFGTACGADPTGWTVRGGVSVFLPGGTVDPYFEGALGRALASGDDAGTVFDTGFGGRLDIPGPVKFRVGVRLLGYLPDAARDPLFSPMILVGLDFGL